MIAKLIAVLQNLNFQPTDEDIADMLWLALHTGPPSPEEAISHAEKDGKKLDQAEEPLISDDDSDSDSQQPPPQITPIPESSIDGLYVVTRDQEEKASNTGDEEVKASSSDAVPFKTPKVSALPGTLGLARALRPLMRRVPSRTRFIIDEKMTAQQIAEQTIWLPVLNPAPARWLELALVIDESMSMNIWWQTITELHLLLEHLGAFRDVRTWGLIANTDGNNMQLRAGSGITAGKQQLRNPGELIDPDGRRLILVVSDCVSSPWHTGAILEVLTSWGRSCPVAIIQVLPRWLWTKSVLRDSVTADLYTRTPGKPNMQLDYNSSSYWMDNEELKGWLPMPVMTLEQKSLSIWARAIMSAGNAWMPGYMFDVQKKERVSERKTTIAQKAVASLTAEQRLKRFRATASPTARALTELLAATPITLPIVRLIQQSMLPESRQGQIVDQQGHVAEIFLSGLLEQLPTNEDVVDPDQVPYGFVDGVRELLLSSLPRSESVRVLMKFTDFVESHADQFPDLTALLADPMSATEVSLAENTRHFAIVTAQVLRRLGGGYTTLAEQIERVSTDSSARVELPEGPVEALHPVEPELPESPDSPAFQDAALASRLEEKEYQQTIEDITPSLGAFASAPTESGVNVTFGVYLPGIEPQAGYEVLVRVNHKDDSFVPDINTMDFPLTPVADSPNNLWQASVTIPITPGTHFGQPGIYLYHYQLLQTPPGSTTKQVVTNRFTDPFARAMDDDGVLSAFVTPGFVPDFVWTDQDWKTPELEDLVVYELNVEEFNGNFNGVIERLPYLKSLGITCLELMPVTSSKHDWGYSPLHYFAPNERWGGGQGLKRLINACHQAGVAVILDVVYHQVDRTFPYAMVYQNAGFPSPMIGGNGPFGPEIDFSQAFARDYVRSVNFHWLDEYHVDGFRYDYVTGYYDGPTGRKYSRLAYEIYNTSLTMPRFTPSGGTATGEFSRIIQCPEKLDLPQEMLTTTYSNSTWQDALLNKVQDMATHHYVDDAFVHLLDTRYAGYPDTKTVHDIANNPVDMPVAPFQYLENHDHSRLIAFFGTLPGDVPFGDRSIWYKLQPFAIALYTCEGIPMLWQGQEFAENYVVPNAGTARINVRRDVHWEYSRDDFGYPLVRLYRILGTLRHAYPALRSHESYYYNAQSRTNDGIVAYSRQSTAAQQFAIVFLNFSDQQQSISIPFPEPGTYREMIDDTVRTTPFEISVSNANQSTNVDVPPNYGYILIRDSSRRGMEFVK